MRIGVDLDGVIFNFVAAMREFCASGGKPVEHMPDPLSWEMWDHWKMTKEEFTAQVIQAEAAGICHKGQAYPGAIEGLRTLKERGHSIHIITQRLRPHAQTSTIGWLNSNDAPYDSISFTDYKAGFPVDMFIEDNIENAEAIAANGVHCVLLTRPWNEQFPWSPRVETFDQFIELVEYNRDLPNDPYREFRYNSELHPWFDGAMPTQPYEADADEAIKAHSKNGDEIRVVSETGGEKGSKAEQYSMIPVAAMAEVARVYGYGAGKYARDNWRKGYWWHLSYDALQRHVNSFWAGQDFDPESGLHHLAHAAFHLFTLMTYGGDLEQYAKYDDRHRSATGERALH